MALIKITGPKLYICTVPNEIFLFGVLYVKLSRLLLFCRNAMHFKQVSSDLLSQSKNQYHLSIILDTLLQSHIKQFIVSGFSLHKTVSDLIKRTLLFPLWGLITLIVWSLCWQIRNFCSNVFLSSPHIFVFLCRTTTCCVLSCLRYSKI